ncbi:MAG: mechanosensitive ion channel family protein [Candidatus Kapaibacterium sp.]
MKYARFLLVFIVVVCGGIASAPCFAQQRDSLNTPDAQLVVEQRVLDQARILDSLKREELDRKLAALRGVDSARREQVSSEINALDSKGLVRRREARKRIDSLRSVTHGYPVVAFFTDTIFVIYSKLGSRSANERADAIANRIRSLADNYLFNPDSLFVVPGEVTADITAPEFILMSVSDNDAVWDSITKDSLASRYKRSIAQSIHRYRQALGWTTIAKQIGLATLVLAFVALLIFGSIRGFRFSRAALERQKGKRIKAIKIGSYEFVNAERQLRFLLGGNTVLKWVVIVGLVYLALPIIFGIFPWTHGWAATLISYITTPLNRIATSIWGYLPNLFAIIVIVVVFRYALKALSFLMHEVDREALTIPGFYPEWAIPTFQIARVLIFAFMLIVIFPYLPGSDSPVFKGVSVFLGVLFTFGSSGSLSNVVAGLILTYMRAFKLGDRVQIGEMTGDIIERTLLVTRIRTIKNEIISIPNSNVMSSHTINYSSVALERGLILHSTVTIGYDVPWRDMHRALILAATRTEHVSKEPAPFVLQTSLDDFYVSYQINAYTREPNMQASIYSDLHQNIQDACNEAGIEIMSPHYQAMRDGNTVTIPPDYLPTTYKSPPFTVKIVEDSLPE